MIETNGYNLNDIRQFDVWGNEPKKAVIKMSKQDRLAKFGKDSRWKLTQARPGGSDTLSTSLYPQQYRKEATSKARPQKVVLEESAKWQEEQKQQPPWKESSWKETSWKESSWKNEGVWAEDWQEEQPKNTPSSSSTSWQQNTKPPPPWRKEESQQKRRK